jgi:hypothetical protein
MPGAMSSGSCQNGTNMNAYFTEAGGLRSGDVHKCTQHNIVLSGRARCTTLVCPVVPSLSCSCDLPHRHRATRDRCAKVCQTALRHAAQVKPLVRRVSTSRRAPPSGVACADTCAHFHDLRTGKEDVGEVGPQQPARDIRRGAPSNLVLRR